MLARPTCHGSHRHRRPRCRRRGLPGLLDALVVFLLSIPGAIFVLDPVPASGARAAGRQRVEGRRVFPRWREVEPARHSRRTACMFIQKPASSWMRPGAGRSRARSRGQGAANLAWSVVPQPQLPMHLTPHKYPKPINPKSVARLIDHMLDCAFVRLHVCHPCMQSLAASTALLLCFGGRTSMAATATEPAGCWKLAPAGLASERGWGAGAGSQKFFSLWTRAIVGHCCIGTCKGFGARASHPLRPRSSCAFAVS